MHGVRQLGPMEVLASAPGGSDSMVSDTLAGPRRPLGRKSQLGVHDAQPATDRVPTSAHTRIKGIMLKSASPVAPRLPTRPDHTGAAFAAQPTFPQFGRCGIAGLL